MYSEGWTELSFMSLQNIWLHIVGNPHKLVVRASSCSSKLLFLLWLVLGATLQFIIRLNHVLSFQTFCLSLHFFSLLSRLRWILGKYHSSKVDSVDSPDWGYKTSPEHSPDSTLTRRIVILGPISWSLTALFLDARFNLSISLARLTVAASWSASLSDPYRALASEKVDKRACYKYMIRGTMGIGVLLIKNTISGYNVLIVTLV